MNSDPKYIALVFRDCQDAVDFQTAKEMLDHELPGCYVEKCFPPREYIDVGRGDFTLHVDQYAKKVASGGIETFLVCDSTGVLPGLIAQAVPRNVIIAPFLMPGPRLPNLLCSSDSLGEFLKGIGDMQTRNNTLARHAVTSILSMYILNDIIEQVAA